MEKMKTILIVFDDKLINLKRKHDKVVRRRMLSRRAGALGSSGLGSRSRRFESKKMFLPHPRVKVSILGEPP